MAIPEAELRRCLGVVGAFLQKRRPPPEIRDQLDFRADIRKSELVITEVRPAYDDKGRIVEHPVAKVKWVGTRQCWKLFWMRADLKWHAYDAGRPIKEIADAIDEVDRDPHGCFFG